MFDSAINTFITQIQSLNSTLPSISKTMDESQTTAANLYDSFLHGKCEKTGEKENGRDLFNIPNEHTLEHRNLKQIWKHSELANELIKKNFIVSLVSQFDAYLGSLIRAMFIAHPEILNGSEKNIPFAKLVEFKDMEEAKEFIIEREVDTILRESHASQFSWLETKLKIPLTKDLPHWAEFIEVTERRNLFVHCNGVVSSQYLNVCKQHGYEVAKNVKLGTVLDVSNEYFTSSYSSIFEIGFKLGQVLWRKLKPDEMADADVNLLMQAFELIQDDEFDIAINLLEFATQTIKKHSSEDFKLRYMLNLAQCHKWKGRNDECLKIINSIDWSAKSKLFKLANAVLSDDFSAAGSIMKSIGANDDDLKKADYKHWPIFKEFIKSDIFLKTFKEVFEEDFQLTWVESSQ